MMLINVKMPTHVGILTFICRINFVLSGVEYEIKFYNIGVLLPDLSVSHIRHGFKAKESKKFIVNKILAPLNGGLLLYPRKLCL